MGTGLVILLVCLVAFVTLVAYGLRKGDVRAGFKVPFVAFTLETRERRPRRLPTSKPRR